MVGASHPLIYGNPLTPFDKMEISFSSLLLEGLLIGTHSFPGCMCSTSIPMWCPKAITSQPPAPCTSTTTCFVIRRRRRKRTIRTASSVAYAPKCFGPRSFSTPTSITATCMRFPRYPLTPSPGFDTYSSSHSVSEEAFGPAVPAGVQK